MFSHHSIYDQPPYKENFPQKARHKNVEKCGLLAKEQQQKTKIKTVGGIDLDASVCFTFPAMDIIMAVNFALIGTLQPAKAAK